VPLAELREKVRRVVGRNLTRLEWETYIQSNFPKQSYRKTFNELP